MATLPSREYLLECFSYDRETDTLTWRKRSRIHFKCKQGWKLFNTRFAGKVANQKQIKILGSKLSRTKIIFIIVNGGTENNRFVTQKGSIAKYKNGFYARISFDKKVFGKVFKTEIEAQEFLKEMRLDFERHRIPIVKHKKVSKCGFHGVVKYKDKFASVFKYKGKAIYISGFESAREASNAYQVAKQKIKDGTFTPPQKKLSRIFTGVEELKNGKFAARYKKKYLGTFNTTEEAHAAYLKAKNHKTFEDGLDILAKLAKEFD